MIGRPLFDLSTDVLDTDEFRQGLRAGLIAAGIVMVLGAGVRAARKTPLPIVSLAAVAASMIGLRRSIGLPDDARDGLLLLIAAGVIGILARYPVTVGAVAAGFGGVVLAGATLPEPPWAETFVIVTAVLGGAAIAAFDAADDACIGPALLAITVGVLYFSVPDTELPLVLLGAVPLLALAGWPLRWARLGAAGAFAVAGLLAWVATIGGTGRTPATIAGVGALGLFLVVPIVESLARAADRAIGRCPALVLLALHAGCVTVTARLAGTQNTVGAAIVVATAGYVVVGAIYAALCLTLDARAEDHSSSEPARVHGGY